MRLKRLFGALIGTALLTLGVVAVNESVKEKEVRAAEVVYKSALFGSDYNSKSVSSYTESWTATHSGFSVDLTNFNNNNNGWDYIKCGRKNNASVGTIVTTNAIDEPVSKVNVTIDALTAAKINSIKLYSSANKSEWKEEGTYTKEVGNQSVSVGSPSNNLYYKLEFDCASGSSNGLVQISKVDFYKLEQLDEYQTALNNIDASMKLGYSYNYETHSEESNATDTLNKELTGASGNSYSDWAGKSGNNSSAIYSGNSAGGNESIQLRSNNNNSGIVTTTSGGKARKVAVSWNSDTANGRTLNVYGKNTAYTQATNLYDTNSQGTLLGTIVKGTSTELDIDEDYEYIGLRSASGAMYLTSIDVTWYGTTEVTTYSNSKFTLSVGIESSISNITEIYEAGIYVEAAGGKSEKYPLSNLRDGGKYLYTTIGLGELLNDLYKERSEVTFTVKAYLIVNNGDEPKYSVESVEYSVQSLIDEYLRRSELDDSDEDYIGLSDEEKENLELVKGLLS